jgi:hypothetical protein
VKLLPRPDGHVHGHERHLRLDEVHRVVQLARGLDGRQSLAVE